MVEDLLFISRYLPCFQANSIVFVLFAFVFRRQIQLCVSLSVFLSLSVGPFAFYSFVRRYICSVLLTKNDFNDNIKTLNNGCTAM